MAMSGEGTVIFSVHLELDLEHQDPRLQQRLDDARKELIELTARLRLAATWAVADPVLSASTDSILGAGCSHEIAVLGERAWLGRGCGRGRLGRELTRRFAAARSAGIAVGTLVLRVIYQCFDLDPLLDHGVCAVCGPAIESTSPARKYGSAPTRFGLWHAPSALRIPPRSRWWLPTRWVTRQEIKRAIRERLICHFQIDARQVVTNPAGQLGQIAAVMEYAAGKRDAGLLQVETIGQIARRILAVRTAAPSRSILQPAA